METITKISQIDKIVAVDLIKLVNEAKGFEKKGNANFKGRAYNWVLLDDILDHFKKYKNWAIMQPMGNNEDGVPSIKIVMIHESGVIISSDWIELGYKEGDSPQDKGIKDTYVRRYSLGSWLGIAVGTDNDGKTENDNEEDISKKFVAEENKKYQKNITKLFERLVTEKGSKEEVYNLLGTTRDLFLTDYTNTPKELLDQINKVFGNVK